MAVTITVENLKSISTLQFDVPMSGAFVLTGANGCGKTSLLTVLHRMGAGNAFQTGFQGARGAGGIDGIGNAVITYAVNGKSVAYRYNRERWSATPKSNSRLVGTAFTEVTFFKADSSRVEPTQDELRGVRKQPADASLRDFMNRVFDTARFSNLYQMGLRGRNLVAHLMDKSLPGDKRKTFYSEKAFSLGELCVMRLGRKLLAMRHGGLYIVDEFEMALHPAAQIRLFREIERLATATNCTVLVSTHSSSLIKSVKKANIIYLENDDGDVTIHRNVYPTYALQHLALEEESAPDKLIFVEDVAAKHCLEEMLVRYIRNSPGIKPAVQVVVVGGYKEVLRFLQRSESFVPMLTRRMAALDADAEAFCMPPLGGTSTFELSVPQKLYHDQRGQVVFLPWTPEVGLCELLRADLSGATRKIQAYVGVSSLRISNQAVNAHVGLTGKAQRSTCKQTVDAIASAIATRKGCSEDRAREDLFGFLVEATTQADPRLMTELSGKLFT